LSFECLAHEVYCVQFQARYAAMAENNGSGSNTELFVVRLGQKNYLDVIERAIIAGDTVLLENIDESVDPVLDPVVGRNTIKKGRAVRLGDREVEYNSRFRLILHTKLANPHYKVLSPMAEYHLVFLNCKYVYNIAFQSIADADHPLA